LLCSENGKNAKKRLRLQNWNHAFCVNTLPCVLCKYFTVRFVWILYRAFCVNTLRRQCPVGLSSTTQEQGDQIGRIVSPNG
jgi:hypothetical protein